jgi:hypothetical protein
MMVNSSPTNIQVGERSDVSVLLWMGRRAERAGLIGSHSCSGQSFFFVRVGLLGLTCPHVFDELEVQNMSTTHSTGLQHTTQKRERTQDITMSREEIRQNLFLTLMIVCKM